jgi:hypothetical protein
MYGCRVLIDQGLTVKPLSCYSCFPGIHNWAENAMTGCKRGFQTATAAGTYQTNTRRKHRQQTACHRLRYC